MAGGAARAAAMAAPMKGAVQGVATMTARRPVKKLPVWPARVARDWPVPVQLPANWNTPERFRPTAKRIMAMAATSMGDWNWKPQPAAAPADRRARRMAPSAVKAVRTPAV